MVEQRPVEQIEKQPIPRDSIFKSFSQGFSPTPAFNWSAISGTETASSVIYTFRHEGGHWTLSKKEQYNKK